jgi:hypothetical protein
MTAEQYHADPCPTPSLSASIAHLLVTDAPARAAWCHPRLNPQHEREEGESLDLGTAAHCIVLEGTNARVRVVTGVSDWRTKAAQQLRDECRAKGLLPVLEPTWNKVLAMTGSLRQQLDRTVEGRRMFRDGRPELVAIWQEEINGDQVWCRALIDYLRDDGIDDYKTTRIAGGANPVKTSRTIAAGSHVMQATFYQRGIQKLTGARLPFRFAFQELCEPYLVSVNALGPDLEALGDKQLVFALNAWQQGLATGEWAGYSTQTAYAALPPWVEEAWLQKEVEQWGGGDHGV